MNGPTQEEVDRLAQFCEAFGIPETNAAAAALRSLQTRLTEAERIIATAHGLVEEHGTSGLYTENFLNVLEGKEYGREITDR